MKDFLIGKVGDKFKSEFKAYNAISEKVRINKDRETHMNIL